MDDESNLKSIWTIGHSTRALDELVAMLRSFDIHSLVDIRSHPGSKRYPHFNKEKLQISMPLVDIGYIHLIELGGRRKSNPHSINTGW